MRVRPLAAILLVTTGMAAGSRVAAQSMEALNLQIHGYATQGQVYSTTNNWATTNSTEGSSAWTEAVLNLTIVLGFGPKLRGEIDDGCEVLEVPHYNLPGINFQEAFRL